jgi:tetratricopeptide (TPR) repeat protein
MFFKDKDDLMIFRLRPFFATLILACAGCSASPVAERQNADAMSTFVAGRDAYQRGELTQAEGQLLAVTEAQPRFSEAYYYLGNIYIRRMQLAKAIEAYERCLELDPQHLNALYNAAVADGIRARRRLQQLRTLLPEDHPVLPSTMLYYRELTALLGQVSGNRRIDGAPGERPPVRSAQ